jgi:putative acetyltransferase
LTLRPASDTDGWEVIALIGACWAEYPGCVMDVHGECPELLAPASAYERAGGAFWVATDPCTSVMATVGWRPRPDSAVALERLYVHRRWRRRGVAAVLAGLIEEVARSLGAPMVELWSDTRFVDAHRFYTGRGYRPGGPDRFLEDASRTVEHHFVKDLGEGGGPVRSPEGASRR